VGGEAIAGNAGAAALMTFTKILAKGAAEDGRRVVGVNPSADATGRVKMLQRVEGVLVQIGLLDPTGLPVTGADSARKVLDPKLPPRAI
jgi:NAD(P)-dependent dehydrogenase (short-subunit alcohol dehydrogenase family)